MDGRAEAALEVAPGDFGLAKAIELTASSPDFPHRLWFRLGVAPNRVDLLDVADRERGD